MKRKSNKSKKIAKSSTVNGQDSNEIMYRSELEQFIFLQMEQLDIEPLNNRFFSDNPSYKNPSPRIKLQKSKEIRVYLPNPFRCITLTNS